MLNGISTDELVRAKRLLRLRELAAPHSRITPAELEASRLIMLWDATATTQQHAEYKIRVIKQGSEEALLRPSFVDIQLRKVMAAADEKLAAPTR